MLRQLTDTPSIQRLLTKLSQANAPIELRREGWGGLGPLLAIIKEHQRSSMVYIGLAEEKVHRVFGDTALFNEDIRFLPNRELPPFADLLTEGERIAILEELLQSKNIFLFSSLQSMLSKTRSPQNLQESNVKLESGKSYPFQDFIDLLSQWGLSRTDVVLAKNEFAVRGGIIDLFPLSGEVPYRIEWFGNDIDTLRTFDLTTQRSLEKQTTLTLYPPETSTEHESLLIDYLPEDTLVVADGYGSWREEARRLSSEFPELFKEEQSANFFHWIEKQRLLHFVETESSDTLPWLFKPVDNYSHRFRDFLEDAKTQQQNEQIFLFTRQSSRIKEVLAENDLTAVEVRTSPLSEGFFCPEKKIRVYTDRELFGRVPLSSPSKRRASRPVSIEELKPGDVVVHAQHGIALYDGLTPINIEGRVEDYLALSFASNDKLYVPLLEMDQVERYIGSETNTPSLSKLGSREWKNVKKKVRSDANEIAADLVKLYAVRSAATGYAFSPDSPWQAELEEAFPFQETPDQQKAIVETKADMELGKAMDRLILGDVGYGKTEVALRAAFKSIMDGKQAAILVPTTILAEQHYETFTERLAAFPVRVEVLSRFKTKKEQRKILVDLLSGDVDLVIGTHRLIQKDVHFHDLGLLIVDEEQRFGVKHKEAIKKIKENVDTMTLSATPIPRTLYLSLVGIRDISVIETPPEERLPVKTFVLPKESMVIERAIKHELERGGQIYYLHNRIEELKVKEREIHTLVPEAKIAIAHGQMPPEDLEEVMWKFMKGFSDLLLCTTIIENGLDIPRVNTLVVERAERYGLAELYQLRGRVGRADRQAYAYFLTPPHREISEMARKRLETLEEYSHLGSGYHIAMKDLEFRGAGNLLGFSQSGHASQVGFNLYCQILSEEIKKHKGEIPEAPTPQIQIDLPLASFIPDEYIGARSQKLDLYRRLAAAKGLDDVTHLLEEMIDRFGDPPEPVSNLIEIVNLRFFCMENRIAEIRLVDDELVVRFWDGKKERHLPVPSPFSIKSAFKVLRTHIN